MKNNKKNKTKKDAYQIKDLKRDTKWLSYKKK